MTKDLQNIYAKLVILETEVSDLRQGYVIINRRYSNALASLKISQPWPLRQPNALLMGLLKQQKLLKMLPLLRLKLLPFPF